MEEKLDYLNNYLLKEIGESYDKNIKISTKEKIYKTLVNIRPPKPISKDFLKIQDEYLKEKIKQKGIVDISTLKEVERNIYLYLGDITTLNSDIIVNPGNSEGLGCFNPHHKCLDNVIHTSAGVELRNECQKILNGKKIPTGSIIICNSYNLPCQKIITTVGPKVDNNPAKQDEILLAKCYQNALEYAIKNDYKSIAFPSISTGLYGYPIKKAKHIAYETVKKSTDKYKIKVIFDVFSKEDYDEYRELFKS